MLRFCALALWGCGAMPPQRPTPRATTAAPEPVAAAASEVAPPEDPTFESEPRDEAWASAAEARIRAAFGAPSAAGSAPPTVECRETRCRVEVSLPASRDPSVEAALRLPDCTLASAHPVRPDTRVWLVECWDDAADARRGTLQARLAEALGRAPTGPTLDSVECRSQRCLVRVRYATVGEGMNDARRELPDRFPDCMGTVFGLEPADDGRATRTILVTCSVPAGQVRTWSVQQSAFEAQAAIGRELAPFDAERRDGPWADRMEHTIRSDFADWSRRALHGTRLASVACADGRCRLEVAYDDEEAVRRGGRDLQRDVLRVDGCVLHEMSRRRPGLGETLGLDCRWPDGRERTNGWGARMAAEIRARFDAHVRALGDRYALTRVECRTSRCRIDLRGEPMDVDYTAVLPTLGPCDVQVETVETDQMLLAHCPH